MPEHSKRRTSAFDHEKEGILTELTQPGFFFSPFIEKVSCFRLAHFNIVLLLKKEGVGAHGHPHVLAYLDATLKKQMKKKNKTKLAPFTSPSL